MKLNKKLLSMLLIGTMAAGTLSLSAASLTKTAQLFYNNIRVKVDGEYKPTNVEPFMINGTVYVSLRDAAQLTDNNVDWNKEEQAVEISRGAYKPSNYEQELAAKNAEIMKLRSQLERLQEEMEEDDSAKDNDKEDSKSLKETLEAVQSKYKKDYNIDWSFDLEEEDDETLILEVSYDGYYDKKDFAKMSNTSVENFMKSICQFIQKEYGLVDIEGTLYNTDNKETVSEFSLSTKGTYKHTFVKKQGFSEEALKDFAKELKSEYKSFPSINFNGAYDNDGIRMKDLRLKQEGDTLIFEVHTTFIEDTFSNIWNRLDEGKATRKLESYLESIQEAIEDEFDVEDVEGYVYSKGKKIMAEFTNNTFKLKNI